ncbi:hypothetical protein ABZR37_03465 [Achromobacter ruhlandii]|uniref:hypothetical protein n=1 Tax=Achromobacter TaxID=222 RepID=UPI0010619492|nr:hypothetical protein [Achromobacter xylosoxidans]
MEENMYKELVELVETNKIVELPGFQVFKYVKQILALRSLGVKHKVIAPWVNKRLKEDGVNKIVNNKTLGNLISIWKKRGAIPKEDNQFPGLQEEIDLIKSNMSQDAVEDVKPKYNLLMLLKAVEKELEKTLGDTDKAIVIQYNKEYPLKDLSLAVHECLELIRK